MIIPCYHRTKSSTSLESIAYRRFDAGFGSLYGPGLYSVRGEDGPNLSYGPYVIRFDINLKGYLILDADLCAQVYGRPLTILEQWVRAKIDIPPTMIARPPLIASSDTVNGQRILCESYLTWLSEKHAFLLGIQVPAEAEKREKQTLIVPMGRSQSDSDAKTSIFNRRIAISSSSSFQLFRNTSDVAKDLYDRLGIDALFPGIAFTGATDGHVVVTYQVEKHATPVGWSKIATKAIPQTATWKKFDQKKVRTLRRYGLTHHQELMFSLLDLEPVERIEPLRKYIHGLSVFEFQYLLIDITSEAALNAEQPMFSTLFNLVLTEELVLNWLRVLQMPHLYLSSGKEEQRRSLSYPLHIGDVAPVSLDRVKYNLCLLKDLIWIDSIHGFWQTGTARGAKTHLSEAGLNPKFLPHLDFIFAISDKLAIIRSRETLATVYFLVENNQISSQSVLNACRKIQNDLPKASTSWFSLGLSKDAANEIRQELAAMVRRMRAWQLNKN